MTSTQKMYLSSAIGACSGVFWPSLVQLFKQSQPIALAAMSLTRRLVIFLIAGVVIGAGVSRTHLCHLPGFEGQPGTAACRGTCRLRHRIHGWLRGWIVVRGTDEGVSVLP